MAYRIVHEYHVLWGEDDQLIARARGSDAEGWQSMSVSDSGLKRVMRGGHRFRSLHEALEVSVLTGFWDQLHEAIENLKH